MAKKSTSKIKIRIEDSEDLYSKYSTEDNIVLNSEAVSFIEAELKNVDSKSEVKVVVETPNEISEERKNICKVSIRKHFKNHVMEANQLIKKYLVLAGIIFVVSLIFGWLSVMGQKWNFPQICMIFIEVLTWVFGWEFIDILVFMIPIKRFKTRKIRKISNAKFEFVVKK